MEKNHWVYDLETLKNLFVACFIHYKTDERKVFIIHESRNDLKDLIDFLSNNKKNNEWHIGFNNLSFDSQIIQHIIKNIVKLRIMTTSEVVSFIYDKAQETIQKSNANEFAVFPEWRLSIQQIDVFKINHWDNANKRTSLKWCEFSMDWDNVQEMPIHHTTEIYNQEEIDIVVNYCLNDVMATKKILYLSKPLLDVRTRIKNKYGLKCYNYSNTKLGSELLLKLYCDATGKEPKEVKQYRTVRPGIKMSDILFPYLKFKSLELDGFHQMLKTKVINNTKKDFTYTLNWRGNTFYYGAGGIHQCIATGIYKADDRFIIKDLDVASLYPSIACVNEMYPAHLGREFYEVYKNDIVDVRLAEKLKKENKDIAIIEGFKEAANSSYGNSNSEYSWLYDPQYTMQTTINGQLLITMLVEDLLINIPEAQLLQTNTDGATLRFPKEYQEKYNEICKAWEQVTKLTLEFADYSSMFIWDVNNYIAVYTNGKTKCKGRFEWEDLQNHKYTHLHKNKSCLIVAKAIFNFFVHDILPEKYLADNRNIFDYCAGVKIKGNWEFQETCIVNREIMRRTLPKTIRYYITKSGCKIIKHNKTDHREIQIEAGSAMQREFNEYKKLAWEDYNVNDSYYLDKIYKEIANIKPVKTQQLLEFPV